MNDKPWVGVGPDFTAAAFHALAHTLLVRHWGHFWQPSQSGDGCFLVLPSNGKLAHISALRVLYLPRKFSAGYESCQGENFS